MATKYTENRIIGIYWWKLLPWTVSTITPELPFKVKHENGHVLPGGEFYSYYLFGGKRRHWWYKTTSEKERKKKVLFILEGSDYQPCNV